jgi:hypothetical protein
MYAPDLPAEFLTTAAVRANFIPPARTDIRVEYIPPPQLRPKFPFPAGYKEPLTALYSIVCAANELAFVLQRYTTTDLAAAKIVALRDQFATVRQSLSLFQAAHYDEFFKACNIDPSEAFRLLEGGRAFVPKGLGDFFRLGCMSIVLLDIMMTTDPSFELFYNHLCEFRIHCERTGKYNVLIVKDRIDRWIKTCQENLAGRVSRPEQDAFSKDLKELLPHLRA